MIFGGSIKSGFAVLWLFWDSAVMKKSVDYSFSHTDSTELHCHCTETCTTVTEIIVFLSGSVLWLRLVPTTLTRSKGRLCMMPSHQQTFASGHWVRARSSQLWSWWNSTLSVKPSPSLHVPFFGSVSVLCCNQHGSFGIYYQLLLYLLCVSLFLSHISVSVCLSICLSACLSLFLS